MNMRMELGADRKRIYILGALVLIAVAAYFLNRDSGESPVPQRASSGAAATSPKVTIRPVSRTLRQQSVSNKNAKFRVPDLKPKDIDPTVVDPTIHLELLAKVRDVKVEPSTRSLFEILSAPPPEPGKVTAPEPAKIAVAKPFFGPKPKPADPPPPPEPKAPKIPLKFYGFVNPARPDIKRAFFLDGEEIVIAGEGEMVKKRYKIVHIGVNSAEVEDTTFKGTNTKQTLPLEAEMTTG